MNKDQLSTVFVWSARLIALGFVLGIIVSIRGCANDITFVDYSAWQHQCERQGGVVYRGLCIDADALIELEAVDELFE
jgi:hypothetical protein